MRDAELIDELETEVLSPEPFRRKLQSGTFGVGKLDEVASSKSGSTTDTFVRWVQYSLNRLLGTHLVIDGILGPATRAAIRAFQQLRGLTVDGIVGPRTETAMRAATTTKSFASTAISKIDSIDSCPPPPAGLPSRCIKLNKKEILDCFEFNRSKVLGRHQFQIVNIAYCIIRSYDTKTPITHLSIVGHTDTSGDDISINEPLGMSRARNVRAAIMSAINRINPHRYPVIAKTLELEVSSRGEREPVEGKPERSRRVEILSRFEFPRAPIVIPARRPRSNLRPERWKEILKSGMTASESLTDGNAVRFFINAEVCYTSMAKAISTCKDATHYVYLLGWSLTDDFNLDPKNPKSTITDLLTSASAQGAEVRVMLAGGRPCTDIYPGCTRPNQNEVKFINDSRIGVAILDSNLFSDKATHHQKVLIVRGHEGLTAFCGGMDINIDRVQSVPRQPGSPMHDVHVRIQGPAALDLLKTFVTRWGSHPDSAKFNPLRAQDEPPPKAQANLRLGINASVQRICSVAIARTFNHKSNTNFRERGIEALMTRAIEGARSFIYIEDQYLVSLDAAKLLKQKSSDLKHITILIAASEISDMEIPKIRINKSGSETLKARKCAWELRADFLDVLTEGLDDATRKKIRVFKLVSPPKRPQPVYGPGTYVHSKTWIVDDELAVIGSANCNRRGWQHDSEVNAFIFDDARALQARPPSDIAPTFAQTLRSRLWSKHLGRPAADFINGETSADLWLTPLSQRVEPYINRVLVPSERYDCAILRDLILDPAAP